MALLAYCIADNCALEPLPQGIEGSPIRLISDSGLTAFVSDYQPSAGTGRDAVRKTVLEFNRVLQELMQRMTILPFRFPTVVDEVEMREFLQSHSKEYSEALVRLRGLVQMEIHLTGTVSSGEKKRSGAEYLRAKQAKHRELTHAAVEFRKAMPQSIRGWREHRSENGTRCYALLPRTAVQEMLQKAASVRISENLQARVSGPWPATEFIEVSKAKHGE